jgi:hypothetical protein
VGGIMPDRERDAAIKRLRKAAENALRDQRSNLVIVHVSGKRRRTIDQSEWPSFLDLSDAWRLFPECERDDQVPSPEEVLLRCDDYDRQKEEAALIAAQFSGGK